MLRFLVIFGIIVLVLCILGVSVVWYLIRNGTIFFNSRNMGVAEYTPQFTNSDLELVLGSSYYLYYKTEGDFKIGDDIGFDIISASTVNYGGQTKTSSIDYYDEIDSSVYRVFDGYIAFNLGKNLNPYCIGVYKDGEKQSLYYRKYSTFEFLPSPSDAWMCEWFDFDGVEINYFDRSS